MSCGNLYPAPQTKRFEFLLIVSGMLHQVCTCVRSAVHGYWGCLQMPTFRVYSGCLHILCPTPGGYRSLFFTLPPATQNTTHTHIFPHTQTDRHAPRDTQKYTDIEPPSTLPRTPPRCLVWVCLRWPSWPPMTMTTLIEVGSNMCCASGPAGMSDGVMTPRKSIGNLVEC